MPKFYIKMNYVVAYSTEFVLDTEDTLVLELKASEMAEDVLHSMDSDVLEKTLGWNISNYESPIVHHIEEVKSVHGKVLMNNNALFVAEFNKTKKEIYG